jgi:hypothetical protein
MLPKQGVHRILGTVQVFVGSDYTSKIGMGSVESFFGGAWQGLG